MPSSIIALEIEQYPRVFKFEELSGLGSAEWPSTLLHCKLICGDDLCLHISLQTTWLRFSLSFSRYSTAYVCFLDNLRAYKHICIIDIRLFLVSTALILGAPTSVSASRTLELISAANLVTSSPLHSISRCKRTSIGEVGITLNSTWSCVDVCSRARLLHLKLWVSRSGVFWSSSR